MALTELIEVMRQQAIAQREKESELLKSIAELSDYETAEAAANTYAAEKHAYSFDGYLHQLSRLETVLAADVPPKAAIEAVDACIDTSVIINYYRGGTA